MNASDAPEFRQRYLNQWRRWLASMNWAHGARAVWAPVLTEQQKQERDEYIKLHQLPF